MKVIAIIPAFNESFTIASIIFLAKKYVTEVIVIDDGSSDSTAFLAKQAGAFTLKLNTNFGKAYAIKIGFEEAIKRDPDVIVMLDGDGQHNPDEICSLINPIIEGRADFVIGSRFLENINTVPLYRRCGQIVLDSTKNYNISNLTDTQSGYRAFGKNVFPHLSMINSYGYNIELDMINHLSQCDLNILEVPITVRYDLPNIHKKNPFFHGFDILTFRFGILGYERPFLCFGIPGIIMLISGVILGSFGFQIYDTTKLFPYSYALMSVLLIIVGLLLGTTALILNAIDVIVKREISHPVYKSTNIEE